MARTSVPDVLDALKDVTYPADRDRLVTAAREAGASGGVVTALRGIPAEEYPSREAVARSVRADAHPDPGRRRTERARHGGKPGLSQHLREEPRTPIQEEFGR
ncbi:DUF2795 domain-containing protein [Streptomyces sp. NPDC014846]|jgi:hypothetical protein|uniref:DUF2795 domain-containing protein n=1 Tax=unclassified Streptomyces TaxID=2593676 RepID=UPI003700E6DD